MEVTLMRLLYLALIIGDDMISPVQRPIAYGTEKA
jgi:hypothetical protein